MVQALHFAVAHRKILQVHSRTLAHDGVLSLGDVRGVVTPHNFVDSARSVPAFFAGQHTVYGVLAGSQEVRVRIPLGPLPPSPPTGDQSSGSSKDQSGSCGQCSASPRKLRRSAPHLPQNSIRIGIGSDPRRWPSVPADIRRSLFEDPCDPHRSARIRSDYSQRYRPLFGARSVSVPTAMT
jgi:hypothetical protein